MFCRPMRQRSGLAAILLVVLLAMPGTAVSQGSGGGGGGGDGGGESAQNVPSLTNELQETERRRAALERELKTLKSIDLDNEMNEFVDKKKTEARIGRLVTNIQILTSRESDLATMIDTMTEQNWIKIYRYIGFFTLQAYLGLPPAALEALMFEDPLALGAFQIVMMVAAFDPVFRAYFVARYGYLFQE